MKKQVKDISISVVVDDVTNNMILEAQKLISKKGVLNISKSETIRYLMSEGLKNIKSK